MPPPPNLAQLKQQLQYPGMSWVESRITEAWIAAHGAEYDSISFNVRLGAGASLGEDFSESTRRMAAAVSTPRADIVALRAGLVTIIEVKVRIGLGAIGQLRGYRHLWAEAFADAGSIRLLAIGRSILPDAVSVFAVEGIDYELFERVELDSAT